MHKVIYGNIQSNVVIVIGPTLDRRSKGNVSLVFLIHYSLFRVLDGVAHHLNTLDCQKQMWVTTEMMMNQKKKKVQFLML